jgi:hypothetical protein
MHAPTFRTVFRVLVPIFLLIAGSTQCFALREIMTLTKEEAKGFGIEVRAKPAGPDHARVELEFKPEGKLKAFTHVELTITGGEKSPVVFAELRETRTNSGNVVVSFTVGRAYLEKTRLSVVMHDPGEAGTHTFQLRMKDFAELEKVR